MRLLLLELWTAAMRLVDARRSHFLRTPGKLCGARISVSATGAGRAPLVASSPNSVVSAQIPVIPSREIVPAAASVQKLFLTVAGASQKVRTQIVLSIGEYFD
jgi:hypothetical protein